MSAAVDLPRADGTVIPLTDSATLIEILVLVRGIRADLDAFKEQVAPVIENPAILLGSLPAPLRAVFGI